MKKAKQVKSPPNKGAKPRECWALYHAGTGEFIRAIDVKPDAEMKKTMPIKYVHMREVKPTRRARG